MAVEYSIEVAAPDAVPFLGYGWGGPERKGESGFRWIEHMEADVLFDLPAAGDLDVVVKAAPMYLSWRRQVVGLYVNGRFVTEWTCPDNPNVSEHGVVIPAGMVQVGTNRLTLRVGYRRKVPPDRREVSLAVESIRIRSR